MDMPFFLQIDCDWRVLHGKIRSIVEPWTRPESCIKMSQVKCIFFIFYFFEKQGLRRLRKELRVPTPYLSHTGSF
jgi:hypothetical protein